MLAALAVQLGTTPALAAATEAPGTELDHCVAIASSEARLACYDKLAGRSADGTGTRAMPAPTPAASSAPAREIPPAVGPSAVAATATTAPAPSIAAAAEPDPAVAAQNFGLSSAQLRSAPHGPQSIEARITQVGVDRGLRSYAVLDNGQTWLSTDGSMELDSGENVTIKRAALGSFMLVSTTSKHSYHVRRIR